MRDNPIPRQRQQTRPRPEDDSTAPTLPLLSQATNGNGNDTSPSRTSPRSRNSTSIATIPRKLLCRLIARDFQETSSGNPFLDFMKDVAFGTLCGLTFILFLSFLDYRNILSIGSGGRLRAAAYELINDPEWMKTIEDTNDVRFVDMDIYNAIQREIAHDPTDTPLYKEKMAEKKIKQKELEDAKKEREDLLSKLEINLNQWCGGCKGGWGFCEGRVNYLTSTYGISEMLAKINLMKTGKCILPS